jgi:hypothetical protein
MALRQNSANHFTESRRASPKWPEKLDEVSGEQRLFLVGGEVPAAGAGHLLVLVAIGWPGSLTSLAPWRRTGRLRDKPASAVPRPATSTLAASACPRHRAALPAMVITGSWRTGKVTELAMKHLA